MTQQSSLLLCVATSAGLSAIPPGDMMVDEVDSEEDLAVFQSEGGTRSLSQCYMEVVVAEVKRHQEDFQQIAGSAKVLRTMPGTAGWHYGNTDSWEMSSTVNLKGISINRRYRRVAVGASGGQIECLA